MDKPFYDFEIVGDAFRFHFKSIGAKIIPKIIIYQETDMPNYYNLVLADVLPDGSFDIYVKSNNGDMEKILATVVQTLMVFLAYHPKANICFSGSSETRTRLYQIVLAKEIEKVNPILDILGFRNNRLEAFETNKNYEGFVVSKKKSNI